MLLSLKEFYTYNMPDVPLMESSEVIEQWLMTRHLSDTNPYTSIPLLFAMLTFLQLIKMKVNPFINSLQYCIQYHCYSM